MSEFEIWVPGTPRPKGSLKFVTKHYAKEQSAGSGPWRQAIVAEAIKMFSPLVHPFTSPVWLACDFLFPRPKTTRFEMPVSSVIGDLDKLVRNVNDALQDAGIVKNDSLVVLESSSKRWASPGELAGAIIRMGLFAAPQVDPQTATANMSRPAWLRETRRR